MITHIDITGVRYQPTEAVKTYVHKKIGRLDRFLPRHARKSVKCDVVLREVNRTHGNKYESEVIMHVPGRTITAKDSTLNIMAAIDIVEAKLAAQLKKYHDEQAPRGGRAQKFIRSLKHRIHLTTAPAAEFDT